MGAIERRMTRSRRGRRPLKAARSASLTALTMAALALPGMLGTGAAAQELDGVEVLESHYTEGEHAIYGYNYDFTALTRLPQDLDPIEADSLRINARYHLLDRLLLLFNYTQDTWSGATAVTTAPVVANGNMRRTTPGGTITGASPITGTSAGLLDFFMDRAGNIHGFSSTGGVGAKNNDHNLVMSSASAETREQWDGKLRMELGDVEVDFGGGLSEERDYRSLFVNFGGRYDFNQKLTSVTWGASHTSNETFATLDPDGWPFFDSEYYNASYWDTITGRKRALKPRAKEGYVDLDYSDTGDVTKAVMRGESDESSFRLGVSQILSKDTQVTLDAGATFAEGYLANPYKVVLGHSILFNPGDAFGQKVLYTGTGGGYLEVRPEERQSFNVHVGLAQYVEPLDAAFHFDYTFAADSWDVEAHTFKAEWAQPVPGGWLVTPSVRYYSQSAASFYTTGMYELVSLPPGGPPTTFKAYPEYYSSDTRLSAFGTFGAGVTVSKELLDGVTLESSFDYFMHRGDLKLGGGGEEGFADYDYWMIGAALKVLPALMTSGAHADGGEHAMHDMGDHEGHGGHAAHHAGTPAGVMLDHTLGSAGDYMVGYTHVRSWQDGDILSGTQVADLDAVRKLGCGGKVCAVTPDSMDMQMQMLHLMYAPTDWLTLAVMPQYMGMQMDMLPNPDFVPQNPGGHGGHATSHRHETGGLGDTGVFALFRLLDDPDNSLTLGLGGTAPTGSIDFKLRRTGSNPVDDIRLHYGMQPGSGTWDFMPSLTYLGGADAFSWGAQATGTVRGGKNDAGYALGDVFQASLWGGYRWNDWLTTTARGIYTTQGAVRGEYAPTQSIDPFTGLPFVQEHIGPFDMPGSYGGQYWDIGLGVALTVPEGEFAGNTFKIEWLQPLLDDVNGYQLERQGTMAFNWSTKF